MRDIERWKTRSGVVKINVAISELPDFIADPGTQQQEHHTGSVELCPSIEYVEKAFQDARTGRAPSGRSSDGTIPTTFDKTLTPEGVHVLSMFTQWCPRSGPTSRTREELEAYADRVIDGYDELAPNFKASIAPQVIGPYEMEQDSA